MVVGVDPSFPPIESLDQNKNLVGFDIDLMQSVAKEAGFTIQFKETAFDRIFSSLRSTNHSLDPAFDPCL